MKRHKKVNIGSVSSGTMRPEDLIPVFVDELRAQTPTRRKHLKLSREIEKRAHFGNKALHDDYLTQGDAESDLSDLFDALDEYAPPYFYFGAHTGDGADYGYWLPESFMDEFEGLKVSDLAEIPKGFTGEVIMVNDHGNVSFFTVSRGRRKLHWAIV